MNILPILNHSHPPAWGWGSPRCTTVGSIFFQSGTHINPDIVLGERHTMAVSAIIRTDGTFELEMKTRRWEDGLGVFYSYDPVDDIFNALEKRCPVVLLRYFQGKSAGTIRFWIADLLREVRAIEEGWS